MIKKLDKAQCCGCSACVSICPRNCITMAQDEEGFYYPNIDKQNCVDCGLCEQVCSFKIEEKQSSVLSCYGAISKDDLLRIESSSGGIFSLLAEEILSQGGVVFGVTMSADCRKAIFCEIFDTKELYRLRGSKYLQAEMNAVYLNIQSELEKGIRVLFSGTGCQVNGLNSFLRKKYPNLVCVEVICHGVPSQKLWEKYVQVIEKEHGKLHYVNFRCKDKGWKRFGMKKNDLYISKDEDPYMRLFLNNICLRPSCYNCKAKQYKTADISMADFWGIENIIPRFSDDKGTSLVIVRSDNGNKLFHSIICKMKFIEVDYAQAVKENPAEYKSYECPVERNSFYSDMNSLKFEQLQKKYLSQITFMSRVKKIVKTIIRGGGSGSKYGIYFNFTEA